MVKVSRQRSAELRIELLNAAATELSRVGYDAMALTTVAGSCDIATSAIYNRFPTKEALINAFIFEWLEPTLGKQMDADTREFWSGAAFSSEVDSEKTGMLSELLLAARNTPALRDPVYGFLRRRINVAIEARDESAERGGVRDGQNPLVQTTLQVANWIGTSIYGLAGAPPCRVSSAIGELARMTVLNIPFDTLLPAVKPGNCRMAPQEPSLDDRPRDQIYNALVEAATDVFARMGYSAAGVADIAEHAGLTTGAIYNRFSGKADLMNAVILTHIGPVATSNEVGFISALQEPSDAADNKFSKIVDGFQDKATLRNQDLFLAARDAARLEPKVADVLGPVHDITLVKTAHIIRHSQSTGLVRSDIDPEAIAWWACASPLGVGLLRGAYPEVDAAEWAAPYNIALEILRTHPTS